MDFFSKSCQEREKASGGYSSNNSGGNPDERKFYFKILRTRMHCVQREKSQWRGSD